MEYNKEINEESIHNIQNVYKIKIISIKQLFIGADKNSFVYMVKSTNKKYFLKIRTGKFNEFSIILPYILSQNIGKHIIEPIKTIDGQLYYKTQEKVLVIYPFITGKSGFEKELSEKQWFEFGKLMEKIHKIQLPNSYNIPYEKWISKSRSKLKKYMEKVLKTKGINQYEKQFIEYFESKKEIINKIIFRTEELITQIKKIKINYCLCHGDIHAGNIYLTSNNQFYVVDWDTLIMAPKERDLMFIGGGIANKWNKKMEENYFYKGYGNKNNVNKTILEYYRLERIIEDIVEFYEQYFEKGINENNQRIIMELLMSMFEKNNVVDMALLTNKSKIRRLTHD